MLRKGRRDAYRPNWAGGQLGSLCFGLDFFCAGGGDEEEHFGVGVDGGEGEDFGEEAFAGGGVAGVGEDAIAGPGGEGEKVGVGFGLDEDDGGLLDEGVEGTFDDFEVVALGVDLDGFDGEVAGGDEGVDGGDFYIDLVAGFFAGGRQVGDFGVFLEGEVGGAGSCAHGDGNDFDFGIAADVALEFFADAGVGLEAVDGGGSGSEVEAVVADVGADVEEGAVAVDECFEEALAAPVDVCRGEEGFGGEVAVEGEDHALAGGEAHGLVAFEDALVELTNRRAEAPLDEAYLADELGVRQRYFLLLLAPAIAPRQTQSTMLSSVSGVGVTLASGCIAGRWRRAMAMDEVAMERVKAGMKAVWMAGDFGVIARTISGGGEEFVAGLGVGPGMRVLDVATGTGNLALPMARRGAEVTGVDIATNLLAQGRERAAGEGLRVRFDEGDAEALPYRDGEFDLAVSMFGAMFAPRPERVAAELGRVVKAGGKVAMANWTPAGFTGEMFRVGNRYGAGARDVPPPVMWGDEGVVRERLGPWFEGIETEVVPIVFDLPMEAAGVVRMFREYFGPTHMQFKRLDEAGRAGLQGDLEALWRGRNEAEDPGARTVVRNEYLRVVGVRR